MVVRYDKSKGGGALERQTNKKNTRATKFLRRKIGRLVVFGTGISDTTGSPRPRVLVVRLHGVAQQQAHSVSDGDGDGGEGGILRASENLGRTCCFEFCSLKTQ